MNKQKERVCQYTKLSIRKNGNIFPCCLSKQESFLGNIFEDDINEIIKNKTYFCECELYKNRRPTPDDEINLQHLHIEFSNECQARCICCQQQKEKLENETVHLQKLYEIIKHFQPKNITVIGGEVLVQKNTMDWLENIKKDFPDTTFDIVTNLCVKDEIIKRAAKIFDFMTVSILGFQPHTYNKTMQLDFERTMRNIDYIFKNTNVKLRLKYLAMPTNMYELPLFFDWALKQNPEKIYLHNIREFAESCNLGQQYWQRTFERVGKMMKKIFEENKTQIINTNKHYISLHRILADNMHIDETYISENGLKDIVKITS